jgi:glycosyltransferase involved in cell wall biosynthesis
LGHEFILLTYEKKRDIDKVGSDDIRLLRDELKEDGIEWHFLRYHKNPPIISTLFDLLVGMVAASHLIRSGKVDAVHVRGITPGLMMIPLSKIFRVKILFDMRGLLAEEYVGGGLWKENGVQFQLVKSLERKLLMIADAVTVLTQKHFDLNKSLDYLMDRNIPMEVVPCCVDTSNFCYDEAARNRLREELGLKDKFVLMYPGKLGTFYYVDRMVEFFSFLLKTVPEAVFFVITHDDPRAFLEKASSLNIPKDRIFVRLNAAFDDMPSYMRVADAGVFFINPYKKIGSSPIKLGEFLASGVPVIINPGIGDTEELVRANKVGVIVSDFDESHYVKAINELDRLRNEGQNLRERCAKAARGHLSKDMAVAKYAKIYEALV